MMINRLQCCAITEIYDLGLTEGNPTQVMLKFCEKVMKVDTSGGNYYSPKKVGPNPGAFYVFSEVVRIRKDSRDSYKPKHDGYGARFAKFIKENKLGALVETPNRCNRLNHPDHTIKVYIWMPAKRSLMAWWTKHKG